MKTLPVLGLCLTLLTACDKAGKFAQETKSRLSKGGGWLDGGKADPELQALVDQNEDGFLFRKDLVFPKQITVKTTTEKSVKGRFLKSTFVGKNATETDGTFTYDRISVRDGNQISVSVTPVMFATNHGLDFEEKPKFKEIQSAVSARFNDDDGRWIAESSRDITKAMAAERLKPSINEAIVRDGLAPRPFWFGKNRLKIGDSVTLTGEQVALFAVGKSSGSLVLKLTAIQPVKGHPCGVFSISGEFESSRAFDLEEVTSTEKASILSGTVSLSLIHPLILQEDFEMVISSGTRKKSEALSVSNSTVHFKIQRDWKSATK